MPFRVGNALQVNVLVGTDVDTIADKLLILTVLGSEARETEMAAR